MKKIFKSTNLVVTMLIVHNNKILLTKRTKAETRHIEDYGRCWHLPGGGLEWGEHPEETIVREAQEELGIKIRVQKLICVTSRTKQSSGRHIVILTYLCLMLDPYQKITLQPKEAEKYDWLTYEQLDDAKILPGTRDQIDYYFRVSQRAT